MKYLLFFIMINFLAFNNLVQAECSGNCVNGQGVYTWPNGDKYVGYWQPHGYGIYTSANGDRYEGEWQNGNRTTGHGTYTWPNGNKYEGDFKEGKKQGYGTMYLADGTKQAGIWENDEYIGPRRIVYDFLGEGIAQALQFLLLGGIIILGLSWQTFLFKNDKKIGPRRIYTPIIFTIVVAIGVIAHGTISLMDERNTLYEFNHLINNLIVVFVFGLGFVVKSYLGPIFLSGVLAVVTYNLFEYSEFYAIPVLEEFLDFVFSALPEWLEILYLVLSGIYILGSSIHDSAS